MPTALPTPKKAFGAHAPRRSARRIADPHRRRRVGSSTAPACCCWLRRRQPLVARISIVVLPFTNLSNDPAQDYLADGVTENLTTELSRLHNSFVIDRNTAFTFKGKNVDAKAIGKELGVRYVLEGFGAARRNPRAASTPRSLTRNPARMGGGPDSRTTWWTCASSRMRWSCASPALASSRAGERRSPAQACTIDYRIPTPSI